MQQISWNTPMPKNDFNFIENILRDGFSPINLLHIFRTAFYKITSGGGCFWNGLFFWIHAMDELTWREQDVTTDVQMPQNLYADNYERIDEVNLQLD